MTCTTAIASATLTLRLWAHVHSSRTFLLRVLPHQLQNSKELWRSLIYLSHAGVSQRFVFTSLQCRPVNNQGSVSATCSLSRPAPHSTTQHATARCLPNFPGCVFPPRCLPNFPGCIFPPRCLPNFPGCVFPPRCPPNFPGCVFPPRCPPNFPGCVFPPRCLPNFPGCVFPPRCPPNFPGCVFPPCPPFRAPLPGGSSSAWPRRRWGRRTARWRPSPPAPPPCASPYSPSSAAPLPLFPLPSPLRPVAPRREERSRCPRYSDCVASVRRPSSLPGWRRCGAQAERVPGGEPSPRPPPARRPAPSPPWRGSTPAVRPSAGRPASTRHSAGCQTVRAGWVAAGVGVDDSSQNTRQTRL